jgi:hypothetical protein
MKCFSEKIYIAYLDDEIDQGKRKDIAAHLESCKACQELVENLKKENLMMREAFDAHLPSLDISVDIAQRIKFVEVLGPANGKKFSLSLYVLLIISGVLFPIVIYQLFMNLIEKHRDTLSFFLSPIPILFDAIELIRDSILSGSFVNLPLILFLLSVPVMLILFGISFLFKKGYESLP